MYYTHGNRGLYGARKGTVRHSRDLTVDGNLSVLRTGSMLVFTRFITLMQSPSPELVSHRLCRRARCTYSDFRYIVCRSPRGRHQRDWDRVRALLGLWHNLHRIQIRHLSWNRSRYMKLTVRKFPDNRLVILNLRFRKGVL